MKIYYSLSAVPEGLEISLAIGNFDGVHLGHAEIIKTCRKNTGKCTVLTFDVHPREFLYPDFAPEMLTLKHEKYAFLQSIGVENIIELPFSEFHSIDPVSFLDLLNSKLRLESITVGFNFFFGRNQTGNADLMFWWGRSANVKINVVLPFLKNGMRISSTSVREFIFSGQISNACSFLAYPFVISGKVEKGRQIGRKLKYPTLNLGMPKKIIPPDGVYITQTIVAGMQKCSLTNIGISPTFDSESRERRIETWVVNEELDELYGAPVAVYFLKKVRSEIRFSTKEKLLEMISNDRKELDVFWKLNEFKMLPDVFLFQN